MHNLSNLRAYLLLLFLLFSSNFPSLQAQDFSVMGLLGVGKSTPLADVHVAEAKMVLFGQDIKGAGSKTMWLPSLSAFRAGEAQNNEWDGNNIGKYTAAFGFKTTASETYGFAAGFNATASGSQSVAIGGSLTASGFSSAAFGEANEAIGSHSFAVGKFSVANGKGSMALGFNTTAESYAEVAVGVNNTTYTPESATLWEADDRIFVVGNGTGLTSLSDAMTILKSGKTGIGTGSPFRLLEVASNNNPIMRVSAEANDADPAIELFLGSQEVYDWRVENDDGTLVFGRNFDLDNFAPSEFFKLGSAGVQCNQRVVPINDNFYDLGSPSKRWDDVYATNGTISTSDRREKKNIQDLQYGLRQIQQLRPVSFEWKNDKNQNGTKLGLIAQEVQKVLPEIVKSQEWTTNEQTNKRQLKNSERLGMYYSDIIPVLVKGIQEQQDYIEILQNQNTNLNQRLQQLEEKMTVLLQQNPTHKMEVSPSNSPSLEETLLFQNEPNPFHQTTSIRYFIPSNIEKASLQISTSNGRLVLEQRLTDKGIGVATLSGKQLEAGIYLYSLILDGKVAATKRMVLTK